MDTSRARWSAVSANIRRRLHRYDSDLVFDDRFESWSSAVSLARGYADPTILDHVLAASQKVANGEAAFERDGLAFHEPSHSWPVVLGSLLAQRRPSDSVRVLDFGGSLGTAYFQNREVIPQDLSLSWDVIEQPHFVEQGNHYFATPELSFHDDLDQYLNSHTPDFCYVGSSLQYVDDPHVTLNRLANATSSVLVLDRLPVALTHPVDLPVIERVPPSIYPGDYAMWIFSAGGPVVDLSSDWVIRWSFDSIGGTMRTRSGVHFKWCGWILVRASPLERE